ncbi:hypothetical protein ACGF12_13660 [Kitasatospora sp. NPDC048296]|uniref:hypothetical protein n=1 Tax=Kitasatospora sp. NPDC048296 TaxID=3364048 RepID=UPI00371B3A56
MPAPTALVLLAVLLLTTAAAWARGQLRRPEPDVYEPGDWLSPAETAEAADAYDCLDPVYLPAVPRPDWAEAARELQTEADAAEARLAARSKALDDLLRRLDPVPGTGGDHSPQRVPLGAPAPASLRKEPTA